MSSSFSWNSYPKKQLLFKLFAGLSVQEFDNICDINITKRYG
ncbi:MAG TPA: hypothetical protein VIY08_07320 [Candidatus Nitrosocosmicus sp.]